MNTRRAEWVGTLPIAVMNLLACSSEPMQNTRSIPVVAGTFAASAGRGTAVAAGAPGNGGVALSGAGSGVASVRVPVAGAGATPPVPTAGPAVPGSPAGAGTGSAMAAASAPRPVSADCKPADKKPDPVSVPITQLQGYQSLTKAPTTGPNKPVIESDPGLPEWTVYRPEVLDDKPHPIVAWAEGGCLKNGTLYGQWLLELASWGYIVLADGPPTKPGDDPAIAGMRQGADGKPQMMAIEWLIAENERPCSQYYHRVTVDKLAVSGQSCGGLMSLQAAGDKRITTAVIGNSGGLFSASALHTPLIYLMGGMNDLAYQNAEKDYMNVNNVPIFNANMDTGHGGTWNARNGGEFGRVGLGWLNWQLKGDDTAKKMFVGPDCDLCKKPPSMWVVKKKMLD